MEVVALAALLLLMAKKPSGSPDGPSGPSQPAGPAPLPARGADPGVKLALTGASALMTAVGPSLAAAAGAAIAPVAGVALVALAVNPFAWCIYILVGTIVSRAQNEGRNLDNAVWRLGASSARAMHEYERALWDEWLKNNTGRLGGRVERREVRDGRLDYVFNVNPGRVNVQGWRTVVEFFPDAASRAAASKLKVAPGLLSDGGFDKLCRLFRACALVYMRERAWFGRALLMNRLGKKTLPPGYDLDEHALERQFESIEAGAGGLNQIPLLNGKTAAPRTEDGNPWPPVSQLVGVGTTPDYDAMTLADVHMARFAAVVDCVQVCPFDQEIFVGEPFDWARRWFELCGQPSGVTLSGRRWVLDPAVFGAPYQIDTWAAKTRNGRVVTLEGVA